MVVLKNGDHLTCEVQQLERGRLQVKTDDLGTVEIEWDKVSSVTAAAPFDVDDLPGNRYMGSLAPGPLPGQLLIAWKGQTATVDQSTVVRIRRLNTSFWKQARRLARPRGELHECQLALQSRLRGEPGGGATGPRADGRRQLHGQLPAGRGGHAPQRPLHRVCPAVPGPLGCPGQGTARAESRAGLRPAQLGRGQRRPLSRPEPPGQPPHRPRPQPEPRAPDRGRCQDEPRGHGPRTLRPLLLRFPEGGRLGGRS